MVRALIEHGAEINDENNDTLYEMQPLHYAARNGKLFDLFFHEKKKKIIF